MKTGFSASVARSIDLAGQGVLRLRGDKGWIAVQCLWKRSSRARHVRLTIDRHNHVILTLPPGCKVEKGFQFVHSKAEWLVRHLADRPPPLSLHGYLTDRNQLSVMGRRVPLSWRVAPADARMVWQGFSRGLALSFDAGRHGDGELLSLLRQFAADVLLRRASVLSSRHRLPYRRVSVRNQVSRWGSCSAQGTISLNWRLLLLPPEIQDYVILHELAHLKYMNHSARYWNFLQQIDPMALQHDAELNRLTPVIMGLGRPLQPSAG